tara:strand:+ start:1932 stop:2087 length:156 start_codon:yes stop_codon:yes gene_type:complete
MTPAELYDALDRAGAIYEIVEIFDGVRVIRVQVWDEETDIMSDSSLTGGTE